MPMLLTLDQSGEVDDDGTPEGEPCLPAGTKVEQLATGGSAFCVLREDGSVWCWGTNTSAIVSYGADGSPHLYHTPQHIPLPHAADDLAMVSTTVMALAAGAAGFLYRRHPLAAPFLAAALEQQPAAEQLSRSA